MPASSGPSATGVGASPEWLPYPDSQMREAGAPTYSQTIIDVSRQSEQPNPGIGAAPGRRATAAASACCTSHVAGVPGGVQARIPAQVIDVPVRANRSASVVPDSRPQAAWPERGADIAYQPRRSWSGSNGRRGSCGPRCSAARGRRCRARREACTYCDGCGRACRTISPSQPRQHGGHHSEQCDEEGPMPL